MIFIDRSKLFPTVPYVLLIVLLLVSQPALAAYQTKLLPGEIIQDGGYDLNVGGEAVPVVYDWDADGAKDLLLGLMGATPVPVRFYRNWGTDANPSFNGFTLVRSCDNTCDLWVPGWNN